MPKRSFHLHDGRKGAALAVRVVPRASRTKISEVLNDGTIKIHLAAPPVEGEANEKLIEFLADILHVPKTRIEIVAGQNSRDKLISILDMDVLTAHKRIVAHLD